jgi:5'-nucleotidase
VISIRAAGDRLTVTVTDDGPGGADPAAGTGLRGITDRVAATGGTLHIDSTGHRGTTITADLPGRGSSAPEKPLGDVIADAQLAATEADGAQVALTNPGGIRGDLSYASSPAGEGDGVVTYGEAFAVQPFSNFMQTLTLTGAQLKAVLEQQAQASGSTTWLQVSSTLHYTWTTGAATGSKVSDLTVNGQPVDPAASYRVAVNNFLSAGGDGFTVFTQGTNVTEGPVDLDALTAYLTAHPNLSPPPADRITVVG